MNYIIITFRSRNETVKFSQFLLNRGIRNSIVNTPKEVGVGCGLSVSISNDNIEIVKRLLYSVKTNSFVGFFSVKNIGGKRVIRSI